MYNENILIFGDSYSTYSGYVPKEYAVYYPIQDISSVDDVSKTWWGMLADETGSTIVLNNSWSGSTICNTGYSGDCSKTSSFICRLGKLIDEGFFSKNKIDRVFIFGATNDSWSGNACGELVYSDWTEADLRLILPGIAFFINKLGGVIEKEKIRFIINTELRDEVKNGIIEICKHYGVEYIELSNITKINGHPDINGMTEIKNQILESFAG